MLVLNVEYSIILTVIRIHSFTVLTFVHVEWTVSYSTRVLMLEQRCRSLVRGLYHKWFYLCRFENSLSFKYSIVPHLEQDNDVLPVSILFDFLGDFTYLFNIITLKLTLILRLLLYEEPKLSVFTPKMKPAGTSETVGNGYHTTRLQIPEGNNR